MNYTDHIEANAHILLGAPVIKGTRISVALILAKLSEGATIPGLVNAYPSLTPAAVNAALAYASDVIANESMIAILPSD